MIDGVVAHHDEDGRGGAYAGVAGGGEGGVRTSVCKRPAMAAGRGGRASEGGSSAES